jgi:hypothetical protein
MFIAGIDVCFVPEADVGERILQAVLSPKWDLSDSIPSAHEHKVVCVLWPGDPGPAMRHWPEAGKC